MSNIEAIKRFLIEEFLPDVNSSELDVDHDLLGDGLIDSLGVLKLITWLEEKFSLTIGDAELDPDNFRSVAAIEQFIAVSGATTTRS
ncbi:acyl carrier protein [Actinophytocola xinjiangensis]|uniref:Acyl carrier protein n=1 Tax=Actinophytocola xinjiangensis TaxID=485602 RepID=A0A7Z0WGD6_9PSEU|nr:phosphopantetheine-binding protein [Actinophytocola xinjiangensis]OLF06628.1 acyl carrier protein [Actinophytocola xinjiangensis]